MEYIEEINLCDMKIIRYIFFLVFAFSSISSFSNHIISSDISYKKINETDFEFKLEFYTELNSSDTTNIGLNIVNYNQPSWQLITPPKEMKLAKIDTVFQIYKKFTFLDTVELPLNEEWIISFRKSNLALVSNLVNSNQFVHYNELYINTSKRLTNNSPLFVIDPIIVSCADEFTTFPLIYEESDKSDSIVFELFPVVCAQYSAIPFFIINRANPGYTIQNPINADFFKLDIQDGTISFISKQIGEFIFTVKVKEYKRSTLVSYYTKHIFVSIKSCDNYHSPYLSEDYYLICVGDSINIQTEALHGNNPHINVFESNLSYSNLMIDSNRISGVMTSPSEFFVNVIDSIRPYLYYNNFIQLKLDIKNASACSLTTILDRGKIVGRVAIVNLFGQVVFESDGSLQETIAKLSNEYNNQILIWRITSNYYDKIETGIFIKQN